jgi:hypothetical protein
MVHRIFLSFLILCNIFSLSLSLSHDRSQWSSPSLSSTTFQNFTGISYVLPEVFSFQHNKKLCCICSTLLVSSLNWSPLCWWKGFLLVDCCFCRGNSGFNFTCTSCTFRCYATQIAEIFHNVHFFLFYPNLFCGWLPWGTLYFFPHSFPFHSICQVFLEKKYVWPFNRKSSAKRPFRISNCRRRVILTLIFVK